MTRATLVPHIAALPHLVPFVGPEAMERARGRPFRARLGANESSFGSSPNAVAAMRDAAAENWMYSDPENSDLRSALAAFHGISIDNITVGEGIDGLLGLTCMMFVAPGDTVVTSNGAYPTFNFHVAAHGGRVSLASMRNDHEDLDALIATAQSTSAKALYVSNPNNPMGTWWTSADITRLISRMPNGTMLLLDEAYADTAPAGTAPPLDVANDQVIRFRTFSKAYGLAGARIGYAIAHRDVIATFDKVRNHYGINRVGQIGALAALQDQAYLASAVASIDAARKRISNIASTHGLTPIPSAANFVAIDCGGDGPFAKRVLDALIARDVFIRKPSAPGLDRCIRVSCGATADLDVFAEQLPLALAAARDGAASR
ncbi:MAG: pyridoxal phosphate-dependent aminotransferase [Hyphomicrobium sp.]